MQYLLMGILFVLFCISYFTTGRDFFAPSTMLIISFIFACFFCIYLLSGLHYSLSFMTVGLICSCLTISVFVGSIVHQIFKKVRVSASQKTISPTSKEYSLIALVFILFVSYLLLREVYRIGGYSGTFTDIMKRMRQRHGYSTDVEAQYSFVLRQMLNLMRALFIVFIYNFIFFYKKMDIPQRIINLIIIVISTLSTILTAERYTILANIVAGIFMFHMVRMKRLQGYKRYSFGFILKIGLFILLAAVFFHEIGKFVGRGSNYNVVDYTAHYFGVGIINLDAYIKKPATTTNVWGSETFFSLVKALRRLGILDIRDYLIHREFRTLRGIDMGNVYTAFRDYIHDFGFIGAYTLHGLFSVIVSVSYEYLKKKRGDFGIMVFSMVYISIVLYSYSQFFYANVIAFGFVIQVMLVFFLYSIMMRKCVRFKIRRRD